MLLENFLSVFSFGRSCFFLSHLTTNWCFFFVWFCSEPFSFLFFSWCEASSCFCCFRIWFDHFYLRERILFSFFVFLTGGGQKRKVFWMILKQQLLCLLKKFCLFFSPQERSFCYCWWSRFNKCRVGERATDNQNVNEVLHHQSSLHSLMLENYRHVFLSIAGWTMNTVVVWNRLFCLIVASFFF